MRHETLPTTGSLLFVVPILNNDIAYTYAKKVLCELCEDGGRNLRLLEANNHPDFRYVHPEPDSAWIKIDAIRELVAWSIGKPQIASKKVAIISPAEALNVQAANAFLKTLEEPTDNTLFILETNKPSAIPATIRSRCHWIRSRGPSTAPSPDEKLTKELQALQNEVMNPIEIADRWVKEKRDPKEILEGMWILTQNRITTAACHGHLIQNKGRWYFLEKVIDARHQIEEPNPPNLQLLWESLLIEFPP